MARCCGWWKSCPAGTSRRGKVISMVDVPTVRLNNGVEMPQIGFGVFRVPEDETVSAVLSAIEAGYRGIDTASLYGNETAVGTAVARCGLPREQLFITTKLWNDNQGYELTFRAV